MQRRQRVLSSEKHHHRSRRQTGISDGEDQKTGSRFGIVGVSSMNDIRDEKIREVAQRKKDLKHVKNPERSPKRNPGN